LSAAAGQRLETIRSLISGCRRGAVAHEDNPIVRTTSAEKRKERPKASLALAQNISKQKVITLNTADF
jgi:hypothetical protein